MDRKIPLMRWRGWFIPRAVSTNEEQTNSRRSCHGSLFDKTSVTLLNAAHSGDEVALNELCNRYWYPLYAWLWKTHLARSEADAQDFVQGFFEKMLERNALTNHRPEKGRFRTYLLACLKNHVIDLKRKHVPSTPNADEATQDYLENVLASGSADAAFEKAWARDIMESALQRLRREWHETGQSEFFDAVAPYLEGVRNEGGLESIGERFWLSHANTRIKVHRLKKQLRDALTPLILAELPDTAPAAEREAEIHRFSEALRS